MSLSNTGTVSKCEFFMFIPLAVRVMSLTWGWGTSRCCSQIGSCLTCNIRPIDKNTRYKLIFCPEHQSSLLGVSTARAFLSGAHFTCSLRLHFVVFICWLPVAGMLCLWQMLQLFFLSRESVTNYTKFYYVDVRLRLSKLTGWQSRSSWTAIWSPMSGSSASPSSTFTLKLSQSWSRTSTTSTGNSSLCYLVLVVSFYLSFFIGIFILFLS